MDLVGPEAQSTDCPLEKWFRDAKIYQIFEGTAQIQRLVIARMQAVRVRGAPAVRERGRERANGVVSQAPGNAPGDKPAGTRAREGPAA